MPGGPDGQRPPTIRPATAADADAWAGVVAAASPYLVQDGDSTRHEMAHEPSDARRYVAHNGAGVVGVARLRAYDDEDHVSLLVMVAPEHRRRGVGRALLDAVVPEVAATGRNALRSVIEDDDASRAAASAWGFSLVRRFAMQAVDPRQVRATLAPDDVELVDLAEAGPRRVWEIHSAVVRDDPSGLSLPMTFEEFLDEWADPRLRPQLSRGVLVDGRLVAFSMLGAAGDRAWSDMTGTLPTHRGRGLAFLVKQHTLLAAAGAGITRCFTGNDSTNQPMLAVNRRLGYRPFAAPALGERAILTSGRPTAPTGSTS